MNELEIIESCHLINQHFNLVNPLLPAKIDSLEDLKIALTQIITHLLDHQFELLLQIMYQIDVSEEKFNAIFQKNGNIPQEIAELVIERELEKIQTRIKYRNS